MIPDSPLVLNFLSSLLERPLVSGRSAGGSVCAFQAFTFLVDRLYLDSKHSEANREAMCKVVKLTHSEERKSNMQGEEALQGDMLKTVIPSIQSDMPALTASPPD